jgi:hypothetical protein
MALAARLYNTGNLLINNANQLDEVTYGNSKIANSAVYSGLFDEVSNNGGATPMRICANGTMQVSGIFDEYTGIS